MNGLRDEKQVPKGYGQYNYAPNNLREVSEEEWTRLFFLWSCVAEEWRQVYKDRDGNFTNKFMELRMWWQDMSSGVALGRRDGKLVFYRFGCDHKNRRGLSPEECRQRGIYHGGRCYTVSECLDCGDIHGIDSSD